MPTKTTKVDTKTPQNGATEAPETTVQISTPQWNADGSLKMPPGVAWWSVFRLDTAEREEDAAKERWEPCTYWLKNEQVSRFPVGTVVCRKSDIAETWGSGTYRIGLYRAEGKLLSWRRGVRIDDPNNPPKPAYANQPKARGEAVGATEAPAAAPAATSGLADLLGLVKGLQGAAGGSPDLLGLVVALAPIAFQFVQTRAQETRLEEQERYRRMLEEDRLRTERYLAQEASRQAQLDRDHERALERMRAHADETQKAQNSFFLQQTKALREVARESSNDDALDEIRESIEEIKGKNGSVLEQLASALPTLMKILPGPAGGAA